MNDIPQIIVAALALLIAFLLGCIIGWLLRSKLFKKSTSAPTSKAKENIASGHVAQKIEIGSEKKSQSDKSELSAAKPDLSKSTKSTTPQDSKNSADKTLDDEVETKQTDKPGKSDPDADKPVALPSPRDGKKDDLKKISGIGPKIEGLLNGLGIFHFDQISSWTPKQIAWVDDYLSFKGRIERDQWIKQAKELS